MPPVSDPENWNWTTWSLAGAMIGFAMHNSPYRITVQWRYGVYMKGPRGPFQTSITINVQNLVVTSPDEMKVLKWDPVRGIAETSFSYSLECAQRKVCDVYISIYSTDGMKVYEEWLEQIAPGSYGFTWDGSVNVVPPPPPLAPAGLYVFDIEVIGAAPFYDVYRLRSGLTIGINSLNLYNILPARQALFRINYSLSQEASLGILEVYRPDLTLAQNFVIPTTSGINEFTNTYPQPRLYFEIAGTWHFIIKARDNNWWHYKNHLNKWSIDVGCRVVIPSCANFGFVADVDTSADAQNAYEQLGSIWEPSKNDFSSCYAGFPPLGTRGGVVINGTKENGMASLQEDAIFSYAHHAWYYWLPLFNPPITIQDIQSLPDGALSQLLLAVLSGCKTAATTDDLGNPVYNITQAIVDKGAKVAVGFRQSPYSFSTMMYFDERLWYYLTKNGNNVTAAVRYAKEEVEARYGEDTSGDPVRIGDGTTVLYPARWAP